MTEHNFSLMLEGDVDAHVDELYEAGLDDALLGETNGIPYAEFDREAPTRLEAIVSAIRQVRSVPGIDVVRVEPEEYMTATEIAQRTGKSREAIRLLATGQRGRGDFPRPFLRLRDRSHSGAGRRSQHGRPPTPTSKPTRQQSARSTRI